MRPRRLRARVENPVCRPVAGDQPAIPAEVDDVDRGRVQLSGFAPRHREDVAVWGSPPEPRQSAEQGVDQPGSEVSAVGLSHLARGWTIEAASTRCVQSASSHVHAREEACATLRVKFGWMWDGVPKASSTSRNLLLPSSVSFDVSGLVKAVRLVENKCARLPVRTAVRSVMCSIPASDPENFARIG